LLRHILWSILIGGGYFEVYPVLSSNGYRDYDRVLEDMGRRTLARDLALLADAPGEQFARWITGYVFAQEGELTWFTYHPGVLFDWI
jgi:hypothetical protein